MGRNRFIEFSINITLRIISLFAIASVIVIMLFILATVEGRDYPVVLEAIIIFIFYFALSVFFGFIGLLFKSPIELFLSLLKLNWRMNTVSNVKTTYREVFYEHIQNSNNSLSANDYFSRGVSLSIYAAKVYTITTAFGWSVLILSFIFDFSAPLDIARLFLALITWLNPISLFVDEFVVTDGTQFLVSIVLLFTSYYSALAVENYAKYLEAKIEQSAIDSVVVRSYVSQLYDWKEN